MVASNDSVKIAVNTQAFSVDRLIQQLNTKVMNPEELKVFAESVDKKLFSNLFSKIKKEKQELSWKTKVISHVPIAYYNIGHIVNWNG